MSRDDRKRRPPLARTQPIRDWSMLFAQNEGDPKRQPGPEDTVAGSVELGYRVVDEYVRRGREAAQRMRGGTYSTTDLIRDTKEVAERMIRSASDAVGAWGELLELTTGDDDSAPAAAAGADAEKLQAGVSPWRLRLRVDSMRAVDVTVNVESRLDEERLSVHALRAEDDTGARIEDVGLQADSDGTPTLLVRITDQHPPGVYQGMLVDVRSGWRVGTLRVVVRER